MSSPQSGPIVPPLVNVPPLADELRAIVQDWQRLSASFSQQGIKLFPTKPEIAERYNQKAALLNACAWRIEKLLQ